MTAATMRPFAPMSWTAIVQAVVVTVSTILVALVLIGEAGRR